jgi:NAD(P)-dependent dehydrogenase (short-subunit alcohol dehydrogenase family)
MALQFALRFVHIILLAKLTCSVITESTTMTTSIMRQCALVTGATDGIGKHTAMQLANKFNDLHLLLHGRDADRIEQSKQRILEASPSTIVNTFCYDLSDITSVKAMAQDILSKTDRLDMFIQNAGVFSSEFDVTSDGLEKTFAVNVAAPFILAQKLFPLLRRTAQSRMLMVSSISQSDGGRLDISNLQFQKQGSWDPYRSYGVSKLQMAMLSAEISARVDPLEDVVVMSCDPGTVNTKMLLAGWGRCGMQVSDANDEFKLISSFDVTKHGLYFVSYQERRCAPDVYDLEKRQLLWRELETITGTTGL